MAKKSTIYEWAYEETDADNDIIDSAFADKLSDFSPNDVTLQLCLVKSRGDDIGGLSDRTEAYAVEDTLPETFSDGTPVPKRFQKELTAYWESRKPVPTALSPIVKPTPVKKKIVTNLAFLHRLVGYFVHNPEKYGLRKRKAEIFKAIYQTETFEEAAKLLGVTSQLISRHAQMIPVHITESLRSERSIGSLATRHPIDWASLETTLFGILRANRVVSWEEAYFAHRQIYLTRICGKVNYEKIRQIVLEECGDGWNMPEWEEIKIGK